MFPAIGNIVGAVNAAVSHRRQAARRRLRGNCVKIGLDRPEHRLAPVRSAGSALLIRAALRRAAETPNAASAPPASASAPRVMSASKSK